MFTERSIFLKKKKKKTLHPIPFCPNFPLKKLEYKPWIISLGFVSKCLINNFFINNIII
jgi:hypothetical protein